MQAFQADQRVLPAVIVGNYDTDFRHGSPLKIVHSVNDGLHLRVGHTVEHRQAQLGGGDFLGQRQCALGDAQLGVGPCK